MSFRSIYYNCKIEISNILLCFPNKYKIFLFTWFELPSMFYLAKKGETFMRNKCSSVTHPGNQLRYTAVSCDVCRKLQLTIFISLFTTNNVVTHLQHYTLFTALYYHADQQSNYGITFFQRNNSPLSNFRLENLF